MFSGYSEIMCCMQTWLALTPYSPSGSVFLLILFYCMTVSVPQPTPQVTNHACDHPPCTSSTQVFENELFEVQAPAQRRDEEANDEMTDAEKPTHECVWAQDFRRWCSASNLALLPDECLSSLLKHAVSNLPHALLSSLLSNMCTRVSCPGFEAANFLPYLRSPAPVYRYPIPHLFPVWDTGKLRTHAFWNGMEPMVQFVWTIPTVDIPSKYLFSKKVSVIVRGKELELSMFTFFHSDDVYIAVMYHAGPNKECQAIELDVQFALKSFLMHDQSFDALERSLRFSVQLPSSMLLDMPFYSVLDKWRDPVPKYCASSMGKAADVVKFTQFVVCANICFVESDT